MRNPLRDEGAAFQVVLLALGGFGLIALASWIESWLGVAAAAVLLAAAATAIWRGVSGRGRRPASRPDGARNVRAEAGPARLLIVLSDDGEDDAELLMRARAGPETGAVAYVVVPALDDRARTWTAEREHAVGRAEARLGDALGRLREAGLEADGRLGARSVEQAVDEALRVFAPSVAIVTGRLDEPTADRVAARLGLNRG